MSLVEKIASEISPLTYRSNHSHDNGGSNGNRLTRNDDGDDLASKVPSRSNNSSPDSSNNGGEINHHGNHLNSQNNHEEQEPNHVVGVEPGRNRYRWMTLAGIYLASILMLFWVYSTFPNLEPKEKELIKLPRNIEDAKELGSVLSRYKDKYYFEVLSGVLIVYIFLQTFAIPGSIFLSILSGFLFNFWVALPLVCFCSATGASFCYGLSWLLGRRLILKYFPEKVHSWSLMVERHRDNLLNYILFLRVTPFLPNWFINITSPVLGVPIVPFFMGTFFGVAPPSFVAIQAGTTLNKLTSSSDAVSWTSIIILIVLGVVSLIPALLKNRLKDKFEKSE